MTRPPDTTLTRTQAQARSQSLQLLSVRVELDIRDAANPAIKTFGTVSLLRLRTSTGTADLDLVGGSEPAVVEAIRVDGATYPVDYDGAQIHVAGLPTDRPVVIQVRARAPYSRTGQGLHRYVDPADGRTYLYSHSEPTDARRFWTCLDQPDLKAPITVAVAAPTSWKVRSNQPSIATLPCGPGSGGRSCTVTEFAPTPPLSSYLLCVAAGPYSTWEDSWTGAVTDARGRARELTVPLGVACRASLAEAMDPDEVFALTKAGLTAFHEAFAYPYPWGKYDSVFVPEYNIGAMENPGLVTFTDARYVFTSPATRAQRAARANTILHELAHMWFGDLVTPAWWGDLWLKESFADYLGMRFASTRGKYPEARTSFALERKGRGSARDQLPTTHPVVADVPDVEAARQNFDGITYSKGAAALGQLIAHVGQDAFETAMQRYFRTHAHGTADLDDLLRELQAASGRDLRSWSRAWLHTAGISTLSAEVTLESPVAPSSGSASATATEPAEGAPAAEPAAEQASELAETAGSAETAVPVASEPVVPAEPVVRRLRIRQEGRDAMTGRRIRRPHRVAVGFYRREGEGLERTHLWEVDLLGGKLDLPEACGLPRPDLVLVNDEDLTYAKVRLDEVSTATALERLSQVSAPLSRAVLWSALWDACRDGLLPGEAFASAVLRHGRTETDLGILSTILAQADIAVERYLPAERRELARHLMLTGVWRRLLDAEPGSGTQLTWARAVAVAAAVDDSRAESIFGVLQGKVRIDGLRLSPELRWSWWTALAATEHATAGELAAQRAADRTSLSPIRYERALAARPDPRVKSAMWAVIRGDTSASNDLVGARVAGYAQVGQEAARPGRLETYLAALDPIWKLRGQEIAERILIGAFPGEVDLAEVPADTGPEGHPVAAGCSRWLEEHPDAPRALRHIVIEGRDAVLRALRAQSTAQA